jgi:hypothetical protein
MEPQTTATREGAALVVEPVGAHELETEWPHADAPTTNEAVCPNCGARLGGAYCAACGQKVGPLTPTLGILVREHVSELLDLDGRVFRSVRLLLARPGFLTAEHAAGRRARYVSPLRLYLLFSVAYFAVAALMPNPDADASDAASDAWAPRVIFMLVPLAALLVGLVTRSTGRHYPQHWYFALHVHAAYFAVLAVLAPFDLLGVQWLTNLLSMTHLTWLAVYTTIAFHTAYGGRRSLALGRAAFVLGAYFVLFVSVIALGIAAVVFASWAGFI